MVKLDNEKRERVAIILHSGDYDRVSYALNLAMASLAIGLEVHMLLTYGGLERFTMGYLDGLEGTSRELGEKIKKGLESGGISPISAQLVDARKLGLKLYACANAMGILNISRDQLPREVDQVVGLVTFLQLARNASMNWYI